MTDIKKPYHGLALTQAISQLGSLFTNFAVSWIIIDGSRSAGWLAAYLSYSTLLYAIFSLVAGRVFDRFNRKRVLVIADLCGALCLVLLSAAEAMGISGLMLYFSVSFVTQLSGTLIMVGTQSVMGDFGRGPEVAKAQASFETMRRVFTAGGPVLAGLLVAALPRWTVFALDSATYVVSLAGALAFIPRSENPVTRESSGTLVEVILPKVSRDRRVNIMAMLVICVNLLYAPVLLLWPLLAKRMSGGPSLMGLLSGSFLAGSIAGGLWVMRYGGEDVWAQGLRSLFLISAGFAAMAAFSYIPVGLLLAPAFVLGLGFGSVNAPIMSIVHSIVPKEKKGRFFGWLGFVGQIGQPAVLALAGLAAAKVELWGILVPFAVASAAVALAFGGSRGNFNNA